MPERTVRLGDGSPITIRPIRPDDRRGLAEGFRRLSPESRYRRFFTSKASLGRRELDYLTEIDHHDHEALLAIDPASGDGVGVARYVRTGPGVAEPAIVVADDWQRRGVGTALLLALIERARAEGIVRFEAPVLASNRDAIRVLEHVGEATRSQSGSELVLTIDLPDPAPPGHWRELLGHFGAGALEPARTLIQLLRQGRDQLTG